MNQFRIRLRQPRRKCMLCHNSGTIVVMSPVYDADAKGLRQTVSSTRPCPNGCNPQAQAETIARSLALIQRETDEIIRKMRQE